MKFKYIFYLLLIIAIGSCKPELDEFTASKGSADFSHFVSVGNSLTAGYADGALYKYAQEYSFPNILADHFKDVGGGDFKQPCLDYANGVGIQSWDTLIHGGFIPTKPADGAVYMTRLMLQQINVCGDPDNKSIEPLPVDITSIITPAGQAQLKTTLLTSVATQGPFNNIGVPGLRSFQMLMPQLADPTPGNPFFNPFYFRFSANPGTSTLITDIDLINPTFYTLWLGNNDVLGYALSGGDEGGDFITPMDPFPGPSGQIPGFAESMDMVIGSLNQYGAKGVLINIPPILEAPLFHTIPWNGLVLTDQASVDALNAAYAPLGFTFALGQNAFVVVNDDPNSPLPFRQLVDGELIIGSIVNAIRCMKYGSQFPLPGKYYLSAAEITKINGAVQAYNAKINDLVALFPGQIAKVDANALMSQINTTGINLQGINFTATAGTGNVFGLDGLHFCPRGNALVAHYAIDAINASFGANIPQVNLVNYPAVPLP